uniref:Brain tumor protein n=1 Tax=Panagrolaimus sp. PS1159 TaxID=55785 RepID=A0AC35FGG2_9BILA
MFSGSSKGFDPFEEFFESDSARYPTPMPSFNVEEYIMKITESDYDMHDSDIKNVDEDGKEYVIKQNLDTTTSVNLPIATEDMYMEYPKEYYVSQCIKLNALYHPQQQQQELELPLSYLPTQPPAALPQSPLFRVPMEYSAKFGDIVVADTNNHRIQIFDSHCNFKLSFGKPGKRDGQLLYPNRIAINPKNGDFVITERSPTHQVQIFNRFGSFIRKFGTTVLQHPRGVCVDSEGQIIVVECKLMRVCIFSPVGVLLHQFSALKHLMFPNNICAGPDNQLFICDNRDHCIKVFNYNGEYLRSIGGEGITNYPISVSIDHLGHILVADNHNKFNLTVFDNDGNLLMAFESKVRHAHCFDAAIYDGVVVVASKDYKVYYYNYKMWGSLQSTYIPPVQPPPGFPVSLPPATENVCMEYEKDECVVEITKFPDHQKSPSLDRLSNNRNSSSSGDEYVEDDFEPNDFSVPPPQPPAFLHPSLFRFPMEYSAKFGGFGLANGQFTEPSGIIVTTEGDIVVADTNNHRIQIFDSNCNFKFAFGKPGKRDGQLLYPNRVAINPKNGDFVITERSPTHQVQIFNRFGSFIRKFGTTVLQHPRGVCVDSEGQIIVVECKLMRVCIFSELFICDNRDHCIKVFNYTGEYLRSIGGEGITNYPISVSIDHLGQILVADNHNKFNLTVFDKDGNLVVAFESKVRHAHCFDAAVYDGVVVVASKDYKVYYYNYKMWGGRQPSISVSPPPMPLQSLLRPPPGFPTPFENPFADTVTTASSMSYL